MSRTRSAKPRASGRVDRGLRVGLESGSRVVESAGRGLESGSPGIRRVR